MIDEMYVEMIKLLKFQKVESVVFELEFMV